MSAPKDIRRRPVRLLALLIAIGAFAAQNTVNAHGAVEVDNAPEHIVRASIQSRPDISGLSVMILDAPRPGMFLSYRGLGHLIVMDTMGKPWLRFSADGVMANTSSVDWTEIKETLPVGDTNKPTEHEEPVWVVVSGSASLGWLDPRLRIAVSTDAWVIPLQTDDGKSANITGTLKRVPIDVAANH